MSCNRRSWINLLCCALTSLSLTALVMERMNGPDSTTGRKPKARNFSETQLITKKENTSTAGLVK